MVKNYYTYRISVANIQQVQVKKWDDQHQELGEPPGDLRYQDKLEEITPLLEIARQKDALNDSSKTRALGEALFDILFDDALRNDFVKFYNKVVHQKKQLIRVELEIDERKIPEVAALPWEFLRLPARANSGKIWMGTVPDLAFSRRRPQGIPAKPIQLDKNEKLRIALVVSDPPDFKRRVRYEPVQEALEKLAKEQANRVELLPIVNSANPEAIDSILSQEPHIFHFIGHGRLVNESNQDVGEIALVEQDFNEAMWVDADYFSEMFNTHRPGVVMLQACEGAMLSASQAFVGVASSIVEQNIPVVVAMQYEVTNSTASRFARRFYQQLAADDPVDIAAQYGRRAIIQGPTQDRKRDFATPVIFMRVTDGYLFQSQEPIHRNQQEILDDYLSREAKRHGSMYLPLLNSQGKPTSLPIDKLCIDLPLKLTHDPSHGIIGDVESEGWLGRQSFTSALLYDKAARSQSIQNSEEQSCQLSNQLESGARLVVVGDPGCGKTTLLSSIAHHYAVGHRTKQKVSTFKETLPDNPWIPVTLVCRDLLEAQLNDGLIGLIKYQFRRLGYSGNKLEYVSTFLEHRMSRGEVLLLVDGLDEIPTKEQRRKFAQFLETQTSMYSQMPMILTSRVVGFRAIQAELKSFKHLNVAPLGRDQKKQFVQAWTKLLLEAKLLSDQDLTSIVDKLESEVCDSRKIAKLCENVLLLTLIAQMFLLDGQLSRRRVDVYRRAIELMIERQRKGKGLPLIINEVSPHLEHLAYSMRLDGAQDWIEKRVIEAIKEVRRHEPKETELKQRTPEEWLNAVINQLGVLNVAGFSTEDDGYDRKAIQFFHQSFQEYFAAQALRHGRGVYDSTHVLSRLRQKVQEIDIVERQIESLGTGQKTEPVAAGHWQEVVRFLIPTLDKQGKEQSELDLITADDAMLVLLPSQNTPAKKARALASFALQCLAEEPDLTDETVYLVLDAAIDNLNDLDGVNTKQNTLMDEAFYAVMQSSFRNLWHERLLQTYIQASDYSRSRIGCILATTTDSATLNRENATEILKPLLEKLNPGHSVEERVDAALQLVEAFYRPQGQKGGSRIDFLPNALLHETVSVLLATAQEEVASNDAVSTAAIWALGWLTSAKTSDSYTTYTFTETQLNCLRQIVMTEKRDAFARMWAALVLSICSSEKTVFAQADWIYEWAVVADGNKPHRQLPAIVAQERPLDIYVLQYLISSDLPIKAKELVAIALGRLGHFIPEMIEPLLQIFHNDIRINNERDEALVYLVFTGGSKITSEFIQGVNRPKNDTDKYDLPARCFLALIGMGEVNSLKHQLDIGMGDQIDINAYAYGLAGVTDPQGRKVLNSMKNHKKKQVRDAVANALSKLAQWDGVNPQQISPKSSSNESTTSPNFSIKGIFKNLRDFNSQKKIKLSPQNDKTGMYVDQEISKQGHLVHKIKAKDSTGRWAYYFVHVRPELEQAFLQALNSNQNIDLEDYGKVIGSCYGEKPNQKLKNLLKDKYGFDV
ncbi:CHAT domain-containing protein [Moorena sp. SIO3H5]|uniref:CHAT domain-containing protein n=1 Tax=Moorena sp. SIO3H5 TaxID=2607834 RepID=UPI0013BB93D6|nr:CHAT domain-containing protein [Moorena sp. SIO3H5]NEO69227.1 CHAT domain-containing protein [Moorena sp. SIO3H5]